MSKSGERLRAGSGRSILRHCGFPCALQRPTLALIHQCRKESLCPACIVASAGILVRFLNAILPRKIVGDFVGTLSKFQQ